MGTETVEVEAIDRLRICLSELGLQHIRLTIAGTNDDGSPLIGTTDPVPPAIAYQAGLLLAIKEGVPAGCYACWLEDNRNQDITAGAVGDCKKGLCHHPEGPARPPREELIGRP